MKVARCPGMAAVALVGTMFFGSAGPVNALQQNEKSKSGQPRLEQDEGAKAQLGVQTETKEEAQPQRSQEQARTWQKKRAWLKSGAWIGYNSWQAQRAGRWGNEHRTWQQRGGYGGFFIPPDAFNRNFGDGHFFRLPDRPDIDHGYPRFTYGGVSFLLLDPWPEYWADNWHAVDDLYIDYDDGYYLHDRKYSEVRLAIAVWL